jgi:hypothetical protein
MEYASFTYASRAHSQVRLLVISDIHQYIYIMIVCAHKYDEYVQHKYLTYIILNRLLNAALFQASNPPTSSSPNLHALPSLKEKN